MDRLIDFYVDVSLPGNETQQRIVRGAIDTEECIARIARDFPDYVSINITATKVRKSKATFATILRPR